MVLRAKLPNLVNSLCQQSFRFVPSLHNNPTFQIATIVGLNDWNIYPFLSNFHTEAREIISKILSMFLHYPQSKEETL